MVYPFLWKTAIGCQPKLYSQDLTREGFTLKLMVVGRTQVLAEWRTGVFSFLLDVVWSPSVLCHVDLLNKVCVSSKPAREFSGQIDIIILHMVIRGVTCSHFCSPAKVRSNSQALPMSKGKRLYKTWVPGGWDTWGYLRVCQLQERMEAWIKLRNIQCHVELT